MVAFFKLANVFGLCVLAAKAASSVSSAPAEPQGEFSVTFSSVEPVEPSVVVANDSTSEAGHIMKRDAQITSVYICVTLTAGATTSTGTGAFYGTNGQTYASLAQNTCVCVSATVTVPITGYLPVIGPIYGLPTISTRLFLSDGTEVTGSAATQLSTSILNNNCGLLGITSITCGSNIFGEVTGLLFGSSSNTGAGATAGVCVYASLLGRTIADIGIDATAVSRIGVNNLRPAVGAGAAAAISGYSKCCGLQCASNQVLCSGTCYTATTCPSGTIKGQRRSLKRNADRCPAGKTACPVPGTRSWDCVDTDNDVETCGGCVNPLRPNARNSGVDCTAIAGAGDVACVRGKCQIRSCAPRFALSADGNSCERIASLRKNKDVLKKARRS